MGLTQTSALASLLDDAKRRGVPQYEIAAAAAVSEASLCAYKRLDANPGIRTVQRLAKKLSTVLDRPLTSDDLYPVEGDEHGGQA